MDFLFLLLPSLPFFFSFPFFSSSPFPLTPSLSPLPPPQGELFDHGLDSWATILLPLSLFSALGRGNQWGGSPHEAFLPTLAILAGFYLSHWEKYITGILYLPWIYDVLQLVRSCVHNCCSSLGVWHVSHGYVGSFLMPAGREEQFTQDHSTCRALFRNLVKGRQKLSIENLWGVTIQVGVLTHQLINSKRVGLSCKVGGKYPLLTPLP